MNTHVFGTGATPHYNEGRAMFFRGKLPCGANTPKELTERYDTLTREEQRTVDGWFDARDSVRDAWKEIVA